MEQTCDVLEIILHDCMTAPPEFVHVYSGGVVYQNFGGIQRWGWATMLFVSLNILDIGRIFFFLFFLFAAMNFVASDNKKTI